MSRVVIVQPHKMLQNAFAIALFPEHRVQVVETIPEDAALGGADVVIVDAASLRALGALGARELLMIQSWKTPAIWIDERTDSAPQTSAKIAVLERPTSKESLSAALAQCLGNPELGRQPAHDAAGPAAAPDKRAGEPYSGEAAPTAAENLVELVDVIEEEPDDDTRTAAPPNGR